MSKRGQKQRRPVVIPQKLAKVRPKAKKGAPPLETLTTADVAGARPDFREECRRVLFIAEYVKDLNATRAAIRAGYARSGAHTQGNRMLNNAKVKAG